MLFKVMLAKDAELEKLKFPLLASPKLDGIRAYVKNGQVFSRTNKLIPNAFVQRELVKFEDFDGELIVGEPTDKMVYNNTISGVMSHDGEPEFTFFVFDHVADLTKPYVLRSNQIKAKGRAVKLEQRVIENLSQLSAFESEMLDKGYEGLILRDSEAPYKCGRSTVREGYLLKLKQFVDDEAQVVGFEERMHNGNEATTDELGRTKRSSHKANKTGRGDLGALICLTKDGVEFNIGTGFTDDQRAEIWNNRNKYMGAYAKFKFFPVGVKEAPRHPVFLGWRALEDM